MATAHSKAETTLQCSLSFTTCTEIINILSILPNETDIILIYDTHFNLYRDNLSFEQNQLLNTRVVETKKVQVVSLKLL